jgi:membrane protein
MKIFKLNETVTLKLKKIYQHLSEISDRLDEHHTFMLASGIAFNMIIYMIPLFLLAIYIVQMVFDLPALVQTIEMLLKDFLPPTKANAEFVHTIMDEVKLITEHAAFFGWIGLFGLLWISSALISSLRTCLNIIFHIESPHFFLIYYLKDILLTVIISILILLYSYAVPIVNFIVDLINSYAPTYFEGMLSTLIITSASILTSFILFFFIFKYVPNKKLKSKVIIYSTTICVLGIELSRYIFAWYISSISNYGKFYGTYAVIISMAVWIYYSAVIILLAAEISKYINDKSVGTNNVLKIK